MSTLLLIILIVILLGAWPAYNHGGPALGGLGGVLILVLVLYLLGILR